MACVAIVGGGFSGSMVAAHLLRSGSPGRVVLIERLGPFGGGIAYGTRCESHVLNVPAGRMSAFEHDPDHFVRWLRLRDPSLGGGAFVPRPLYGQYVRQVLAEAETAAAPGAELERVPGQAVALLRRADGINVKLADGRTIHADAVLLAIGNFPPADPEVPDARVFADPRYARDPWAHDALDVGPDEPVLLLGTGLTMLDLALALRDRGHRGPIHAVSRRGLLPQPHRAAATAPPHHARPPTLDRWERTALGLLRGLRREVRSAARRGVDWREVVTSIRADTPALWQSLSIPERRRFLDRLRPFWETHRHRAAPQTWAGVEGMIRAGQLRIRAGRLERLELRPGGIAAHIRSRSTHLVEVLVVAKVINCTGPDTDLRRVREPLIVQLRDAGLVRPDALGLGLDTHEDGRVIDAAGRPNERLMLIGPLRKGLLWENTAVPELRIEAARVARGLAASLAGEAGPGASARAVPAETE